MPFPWIKKENLPVSYFNGTWYGKRPGIDWSNYLQVNGPINYLEVGVLHGANLLQIAETYAKHPDSKMYCIDPWQDYIEYNEYKGLQNKSWDTFNSNLNRSIHKHKIIVNRGFSHHILPTFENEFFDVIFIDGNHETEFVYKDGVMSFDKLKHGGYMIFDDYDSSGRNWPETKLGIDNFIEEYNDRIKILSPRNSFMQFIIQKL
jgi:predicted O-methyltransferase YrrM